MNTTRKTLAMAVTMTGLLAAGAVFADSGPIRLTDAQMDEVVAGDQFQDQIVSVDVQTGWFHGYSSNPAAAGGPGTSEQQVTTTTTTTRILNCPGGSINSCYVGNEQDLNPNTTVVSSSSSSTVQREYLSGPGQSFMNR